MLCFAGKGRLKPWSSFEADRVIRGVERHQSLILVRCDECCGAGDGDAYGSPRVGWVRDVIAMLGSIF